MRSRKDVKEEATMKERVSRTSAESTSPVESIPSPPPKPKHVRDMFAAWNAVMETDEGVKKGVSALSDMPRRDGRRSSGRTDGDAESVGTRLSSSSYSSKTTNANSATATSQTKRSHSMATWRWGSNRSSNKEEMIRTTMRKRQSERLEKRVTMLPHNKTNADRPDHVQAMFAAWNSAMVGGDESTATSNQSSASDLKRGENAASASHASMLSSSSDAVVSVENSPAIAPRSVVAPRSVSPTNLDGSSALQLEKKARDRMLVIAENAEAEKYALLLRHGKRKMNREHGEESDRRSTDRNKEEIVPATSDDDEDDRIPGVSIRDMSRSFWTYPNVFSSHEAIPWLLEHTDIKTRQRCVELGERMVVMGLIVPAGTNHHFKDKRQFWRFNTKKVARSGRHLRRNSKLGDDRESEQRSHFRPLKSISDAFRRSRTKNVPRDEDDSDEDDSDEYDSDEAYYNPDEAEEDWDMCDPDERARNIFVAEVTKRKYAQGIINYEEMCHMLKLIGVRPPPKDGEGLSTNERVEKSAREKYDKGIISFEECCHLLRVIGVTNMPERKSHGKDDTSSDDSRDDRSKDLSSMPASRSSESNVEPLETGDFFGGAAIASPSNWRSRGSGFAGRRSSQKKKIKKSTATVAGDEQDDSVPPTRRPPMEPDTNVTTAIETTSATKPDVDDADDVDEGGFSSSGTDYGSDIEEGLDNWDDMEDSVDTRTSVGSSEQDALLKSVSIMSSHNLESALTKSLKKRDQDGTTARVATIDESEPTSLCTRDSWMRRHTDTVLRAAQDFLSTHKSNVCLEMLIHICEKATLDQSQFASFLRSFESETYNENETIVRRGVALTGWYIVTSGHVVVTESNAKIRLHEGNCFGSPALLKGRNGGNSIFSRSGGDGISVSSGQSACVLAKMTQDVFHSWLKRSEGLSNFFTTHAESVMKKRERRQSYQKARRSSMNLARKRQIKGIAAEAKTTRKARFTRSNSGHRMVNKYKILSRLGRGSYGDVRKCEDTLTKRVFAVKIINRSQLRGGGGRSAMDAGQFEQLELEVKILREMRHPNVVLLHEVIDDQAIGKLYIIQEFVDNGAIMPETLFSTPLKPDRAWRLFRDILRGLEYLHAHLIIHRDLKPSNILIDKDDNAKIADFGMATSMNPGQDLADAETAGSPAFMAPEVCGLMGNEPYSGQQADMWSAGATLFAMLFGHPPYIKRGLTLLEQFEVKLQDLDIPSKPADFPFEEWAHCQNVLRQMLHKSWRKRLRLRDLKHHEYITKQGTTKLHQLEYQYES